MNNVTILYPKETFTYDTLKGFIMNNKGYHYTSIENWKKIQNEGLMPQKLDFRFDKLITNNNMPNKGIWVYRNIQNTVSEFGCVVWQHITKKSYNIVLLEVSFNNEHIWTDKKLFYDADRNVHIKHDLTNNDIEYHMQEPATLLFKTIPINNIKLLKVFNLESFSMEDNNEDF